ncbi:hypothetical protein ACQEVZ_28790 [Dactylosporangium sp. CA-152071]
MAASSLIDRLTVRTQGVSIDPMQTRALLQALARVPDHAIHAV